MEKNIIKPSLLDFWLRIQLNILIQIYIRIRIRIQEGKKALANKKLRNLRFEEFTRSLESWIRLL
jgi:hypothetical protein